MRRTLAFALVGVALLAACGTGDDGTDRDGPLRWPREPSAEVLLVDSGGGLPPPEAAPERFGELPDFVIYGDGLVVWRTDGPFQSARLDTRGVRQVLGWADDAGLLAPGGVDAGEPQVYDVPGISYEVTTDSGTEKTRVIAPGFKGEDIGLTDEQIEARARLSQFHERIFSLPESMPEERFRAGPGRLDVSGWEVLSRPTKTYTKLSGDEPRWTFDDPGKVGRCRVVTGAAQRRFEALIDNPGEGSVWEIGGEPWVVFARPLLRGAAEPCPSGGE